MSYPPTPAAPAAPTPTPPEGATPPAPGATPPAATPPAPAAPSTPAAPEYPPELGDPGKRALDEERRARAKAEQDHRDVMAELTTLRQQQMTEQERAVETAREEGRQAGRSETIPDLVEARIAAEAATKKMEPAATASLLKRLNHSAFIDSDGKVDTAAVAEFIESIAVPPGPTPPVDLGQGRRPGAPAGSKADAGRAEAEKRFGTGAK